MQFKKYICLLTSFETLNLTYHSQKRLYDSIYKEFGTLYFINIDNLKFFSKPKKYDFTNELKNLPKNIIFFNPQNTCLRHRKLSGSYLEFIRNDRKWFLCSILHTESYTKWPEIISIHHLTHQKLSEISESDLYFLLTYRKWPEMTLSDVYV